MCVRTILWIYIAALFINHPQCIVLYLPTYSPSLNPIEDLFLSWRWKVNDCHPPTRVPLLQAMEDACVGASAGWICHSRRISPRCSARDNMACDVNQNVTKIGCRMWPHFFFLTFYICFCLFVFRVFKKMCLLCTKHIYLI